jgi:hypothetical protein
MISPYHAIVQYDEGDEFFDEHLKKIYLFDVFKDLCNDYKDPKVLRGVVLFILWGYSIDSDMLSTNHQTWTSLSKKIFDRTGLDKEHFEDVANLENDNVRAAIDRWVEFQNNEHWTQYITYRDLRKQFLSAALVPFPKSTTKMVDGELVKEDADYSKMKSLVEAKQLCAINSDELLKRMEDAKGRFIRNHPKLKLTVGELNKVTQQKTTLSTEEIFAKAT